MCDSIMVYLFTMLELFKKKEEIDYKELVKQGAIIVDVRSKEEFESGHISGAINMPLETLSSDSEKIEDKNSCVITCCMSGGRSSVAKNILHSIGYTNVYNGGGWRSLESALR